MDYDSTKYMDLCRSHNVASEKAETSVDINVDYQFLAIKIETQFRLVLIRPSIAERSS